MGHLPAPGPEPLSPEAGLGWLLLVFPADRNGKKQGGEKEELARPEALHSSSFTLGKQPHL